MKPDWEEFKAELQAFGEKLMHAGWITSFRIGDQDFQIKLNPTPLGKKKLKQLWNVLHDLDGSNVTPLEIHTLLSIMYLQAEENRWK